MTGPVFPFPLYKVRVFRVFFGLHGVAASSLIGLHDLALVSVVNFPFKNNYEILPLQRSSSKFFHVGLRVSLFVHALFDVARH